MIETKRSRMEDMIRSKNEKEEANAKSHLRMLEVLDNDDN